jgi:hypothetical protein
MTEVMMGICAILTVMVVVLAIMGWSLNKEVGDQYEEIKELRDYVANVDRRLTTLEHKSDKKCDRVEIVHKYDDSGAPKYGGF